MQPNDQTSGTSTHYLGRMTQALLPESSSGSQDELPERMVAWSTELSEFDIQYEPRGSMKTQFMIDFSVAFVGNYITTLDWWTLFIDDVSNIKGSGAGIILEGPDNITLEQSLKLNFKASTIIQSMRRSLQV